MFSGLFSRIAQYLCLVNAQGAIPTDSNEMVTISRVEFDALKKRLGDSEEKILVLQQQLLRYQKMLFGSKSERHFPLDQAQISLELEGVENPEPDPSAEPIREPRKNPAGKKKGHPRLELPDDLPREVIEIEPDHDVTGWKKIGEEVTEVLARRKGTWYVKRFVRSKYAAPNEEGVVIGKLPLLPIHKGNADASVIAFIIISKFCDHLPWYRQIQQYKREGIEIAESTMIGWFRAGSALLMPLYDLHKESFLRSTYIQADETPIKVQSRDVPGSTHKGYFWVYFDPLSGNIIFEYRKGRGREGPMEFLENYKGALQTDGYAAYEIFGRDKDIDLLACMAHARRKFDEAKQNDYDRAKWMLDTMQELYTIERKAAVLKPNFDAIRDLRQQDAVQVLEKMEKWLKDNLIETLPKSAIGMAIAYTLNLWPRLIRYVEDGRFRIDNNLIENTIRPVVIGRKNYLFAGSHEAAQRAAMVYSFVGTCKQIKIDPSVWLENVIERLPCFKKDDDLSCLLPVNWKKQMDMVQVEKKE